MRTRVRPVSIEHLRERDGDEVTALERHHGRVAAGEEILLRTVAEVARVLHVERDRIRAAELVPDVLGHDEGLDAVAWGSAATQSMTSH
jgi:hypothetical protein